MMTGATTRSLQVWIVPSLICFRIWASQGSSKGANEMLPFLMSSSCQGKKGGLKFNADEISAIIEVLKMGKSPAEAQKLDKVVNLMKMMR